jgi:hypothetical protein
MNRPTGRFWLMWVLLLAVPISAFGQEFKCRVQINTQQIPGTDKVVYERFRNVVQEYMNNTNFSSLELTDTEKLDCNMMFIFKKREGENLTCDLQIQSSRPVYGSNYTTTLLNFREELSFAFSDNQTLTYQPDRVEDNLTATLDFWAFVMLGLDSDSFSKLGGTSYFQHAQDIVQLAQGKLGDNWKGQVDRNHWGWINSLTNTNQNELRLVTYQYHRLGLDSMHLNTERGRAQILNAINSLSKARKARPNSPLISNFIETKCDEMINILSTASSKEKQEAYDLLSFLYPSYSNRLQSINNSR